MFSLKGDRRFNFPKDEGGINSYGFFRDNRSFFVSTEDKVYFFSLNEEGIFIPQVVYVEPNYIIISCRLTSNEDKYILDIFRFDEGHYFYYLDHDGELTKIFKVPAERYFVHKFLGATNDNRYFLIERQVSGIKSLNIIDSYHPEDIFTEEGLYGMTFFTLNGKEGQVYYYVTGFVNSLLEQLTRDGRFLYQLHFREGVEYDVIKLENNLSSGYYAHLKYNQDQTTVSLFEEICAPSWSEFLHALSSCPKVYHLLYLSPYNLIYGNDFTLDGWKYVHYLAPITPDGKKFGFVGDNEDGRFFVVIEGNKIIKKYELDTVIYDFLRSKDNKYWFLVTRNSIYSVDLE